MPSPKYVVGTDGTVLYELVEVSAQPKLPIPEIRPQPEPVPLDPAELKKQGVEVAKDDEDA